MTVDSPLGPQPDIKSFVLRFIVTESPDPLDPRPAAVRGVIRHIQTDEEISFTHWEDAVQFIGAYLLLNPKLP